VLVPAESRDVSAVADDVRETDPDVLFVLWPGAPPPALWRELARDPAAGRDVVATLPERAAWPSFPSGIDFVAHYAATLPRNAVNDWLVRRMRARNQVPDLHTVDGFNAALMIVRAVGRGGRNVERMVTALEGWQFAGPKGVNRVRERDHALVQPMFHARVGVAGGRLRAVPVRIFSPGNLQPPLRPIR
jgi:branched-chain amino acid transport system substrate-binding protein